jgi:hypothetical protein
MNQISALSNCVEYDGVSLMGCSPMQTVKDLRDKLRKMRDMLPKEKRGKIEVFEKNDPRTRRLLEPL